MTGELLDLTTDPHVLTAGGRTDWFCDPLTGTTTANAPLWLLPVTGDFQLQTQVTAPLAHTFDAGTLFVFADPTHWAKLAYELAPRSVPMIVSVVTTRGASDDANGPAVARPGGVWLRVSRLDDTYAFHYSTDATWWDLVRVFTLGPSEHHRVGLGVQSPTGPGLTATFGATRLSAARLADLRGGD